MHLEEVKLYWGSKIANKDNKVKKHQQKKQAILRSKEQIDRNEIPIWQKKISKEIDIMIRPTEML